MRFALIALLLLSACPGHGPTDATPEGAVEQLLTAMRFRDREEAYGLLAPETQRELQRRAREATEQAGRTIEPREMLAAERFLLRWELGRMTSEVSGDDATVTVTGAQEGQRAEVRTKRVDGHWRVILPL